MANPKDQDFLRVVITRINDWGMTGNFLPLLDMFHRQGRIVVSGAYGLYRLDTREEQAAFLRDNRPSQSLQYTHESEMPIGAFASFRWQNQAEDVDAGNLVTEMLDGKILQLLWEFMPVTRHPMAFAQGGAPAATRAPGAPASPFKPMSAAPAGLATPAPAAATRPTPAAPSAPARPAPAASAAATPAPAAPVRPTPAAQPPAAPAQPAPPPSPTKPVFL